MACSLQKLFAVEEEFEDEDFLSAVEDVESQFAGSLPVTAGHLRPVSPRPQEAAQPQSSRLLPRHPAAPSEASGLPALGLRLAASSTLRAARGPASAGTALLRPASTSSSLTGDPRGVTRPETLPEPARPQASAPRPLCAFKSPQQGLAGFEGCEHDDDFDKVLASMELEGPGTELERGESHEAAQTLPAQPWEDSVLAKKARVADVSGSGQKGPVPDTCAAGVLSAQDEPLGPVVHCRTPRPCLRPGASGSLPVPPALAVPTRQRPREVCPGVSRLPPAAGGAVQGSPREGLHCQSVQSPGAWAGGRPRFPGPRTPSSSCSARSTTGPRILPQSPLRPRAPGCSVESPVGIPRAPHPSLVPQAALQTPVVTNHLVQLVTAASRTPQLPGHRTPGAKTRRFPGPAGLLPHQHSGRNLEEIMVSTPQTPAHGALAKFRTEIVASSQASVEEDFGRGPWLTMKSALGLDERDPTCFLCSYSIVMVLRKAALKQLPRNKVPNMAVMIKSLTRSAMDASVVFKDPTGEMQGTVHRVLLETRQSELKPGSVLLLRQIGVFSPSLRNHYLNVTPNNLVHIYSADPGDGSLFTPSRPFPEDPGCFHSSPQHDAAAKPGEGRRAAQAPEAGPSAVEDPPEADDLDGLLSELPEDFFGGTGGWDCPQAGHPP
ncbi:homologous recombination OB-fold protein isoform X1 [Lepus europaeus]|uniref:homologous recombination OB-fold protein isoform X1 n=1 Tax=Lepus europaeus TaxID=9983 RepID=UPI002B45BC55|nr:homologous recombination OB-fold protein isoform X1 [Lepus europaeus]